MNRNFAAVVVTTFAWFALACFAAPQGASAQKPGTGQEPVNKSCVAQDKVEVTQFSVTPSLPRDGDTVSVRMRIKNKCSSDTKPLSVDWDIGVSRNTLSGGTARLNAGGSSEFTAQWTARAGDFKIHGGVVHDLDEAAGASMENNRREASFHVIKYGTQWLEVPRAKSAGARFVANTNALVESSSTKIAISGRDPNSPSGPPEEIVMRLDGHEYDMTAHFSIFDNFRLKNGWKVKKVENVRESHVTGCTLTSSTANPYRIGTDHPLLTYEFRASGCVKELVIKIQIEGPEGTNPYQ